jgi:hypothetical protein
MRAVVFLSLLALSTAAFAPQITKPSSITAYRSATHGNGTGTLFAVAADGYS